MSFLLAGSVGDLVKRNQGSPLFSRLCPLGAIRVLTSTYLPPAERISGKNEPWVVTSRHSQLRQEFHQCGIVAPSLFPALRTQGHELLSKALWGHGQVSLC